MASPSVTIQKLLMYSKSNPATESAMIVFSILKWLYNAVNFAVAIEPNTPNRYMKLDIVN